MGGFSLDWLADAAGTLADLGGYSSSFRLFHMMKIPFHKDATMLLLFCGFCAAGGRKLAGPWQLGNDRVSECDPGVLSKRYIANAHHASGCIVYIAFWSRRRRS